MASSHAHIMLSYNWEYQDEVRRIRDILNRFGMNVWMDIDSMSGDIYSKMAEGVEGASIIIVCMSSKYQASENCIKEFEYAQVRGKVIIPIKLEKGFNATGALGLITAGKLYIDFSDTTKFNENIRTLTREIQSLLKVMSGSVPRAARNSSEHSDGWLKVKYLDEIDHFLVDDVEFNRPGCLALKSCRKRWLSADSDSETIKADRTVIGRWEKFGVRTSSSGNFAIQAWTGRYLSAHANGMVNIASKNIGANETWTIYSRNYTIALKSCHGTYLTANPNGDIQARKDSIGNYEQFYHYEEGDPVLKR